MNKYYVFHETVDSYVEADEVNLTVGGELVFSADSKLVACYHRGCWSYFKQVAQDLKS